MKIKLAVAMLLMSGSVYAAKSYDITLAKNAKAGSLDLAAGDYSVSHDGNKVKFTAVKSGKSMETDATVENADKKFSTTLVDTEATTDTIKIHEIDLGGTVTKLKFQ